MTEKRIGRNFATWKVKRERKKNEIKRTKYLGTEEKL